MWCGYNNEIVLLHTTDGTIYRSRDRGLSWKRLRNLLHKQGIQVADEDQEVSLIAVNYATHRGFLKHANRFLTLTDWSGASDGPESQR